MPQTQENQHTDMDMAIRAAADIRYRMSDEFGEWLADDAHRRLFGEVLDAREAVLRLDPQASPDTDEALGKVLARAGSATPARRAPVLLWSLAGVAATIAVILCVWLGFMGQDKARRQAADIRGIAEAKPVYVLHATTEPQLVLLSTGNGEKISVLPENRLLLVRQGVRLSDSGITYASRRLSTDIPPAATHTLTTPRGQTIRLELADGTMVWLNSESRITYPKQFAGSERRVRLEGEAYFEVAHNEQQPFVVEAAGVETRVLGTEFNIRAYAGRDCNVTLVRGSVVVRDLRSGREQTLTPGENAVVRQDGKGMATAEVDVMERTAWKDNYFCFRNEELADIMTGLSHWYNVEVVFTKEKSMHYHFNFWADKEASLESTIHLLNEVGKVKVRMRGKRVIVY